MFHLQLTTPFYHCIPLLLATPYYPCIPLLLAILHYLCILLLFATLYYLCIPLLLLTLYYLCIPLLLTTLYYLCIPLLLATLYYFCINSPIGHLKLPLYPTTTGQSLSLYPTQNWPTHNIIPAFHSYWSISISVSHPQLATPYDLYIPLLLASPFYLCIQYNPLLATPY